MNEKTASHPKPRGEGMKRLFCLCLAVAVLIIPVRAEPIKWVDFQIPYESLKYAMDVDIKTFDQEKHIRWVDALSLAGCRTGGKCGLNAVKKAVKDLHGNDSPEKLLGELYKYYDYYHQAYEAVLGGLLGSYSIEKDGKQIATYGLKALLIISLMKMIQKDL